MEVPTHLKQAFTPEQLREHRELFDSFDEDGGGTIDAPEMAKLADALGLKVTVDGAKKLIEEIDLDGDGLVDFVEFLTLLVDLQAGGLDREKMKKSSQLTQLMSMAVKRADEVRARKEEKIAAAQKGRELIVAQNEIEREGKAKNAKKLKEQEKILIVKRNEASRRASLQRLDEEDRKIEEAIAAKDDIIRQKAAEGQRRAEEEKKKVFLLAEEKGAVLLKKGADSQVRKLQLAEEDEVKRVSIELEKRKQRAIAARRADIERGFTRVQLEALREQFDATDTDNSQSIDAGELYAVCQKLGEDLTMKQIKKLIAEVDDDNSGEIEWEEYLLIMGKKRDEAMKKGSGLFQKMSMRADQAAIKKQEKIDVLQRQKEEQYAVQEVARREAVERASKQKVLEQEAIIAKNIAKEEEALIRVENVEVEKELALHARALEIQQKAMLGQHRAAEAQNQVWEIAEQKRLRTEANAERSAWIKQQKMEEDEQMKVAAEAERKITRTANARRAEIERNFTRVQLEALREQFDEADTDNSQSIDAGELHVVCQTLGENMTMKQVEKLIAEVDDDGSGEIEWEEYLMVMGKKREEAQRKGSGLFQMMAKRASEATKKKEEAIVAAQRIKEARVAENVVMRDVKAKRAAEVKEREKEAIALKNEQVRLAAIQRLDAVERDIALAEIEKEKVIRAKAEKAAILAAKEKKAVFDEAKKKGEQTKKAAAIAIQRKTKLADDEEKRKIAIEMEKQIKREKNAKRGQIEKLFTPNDLAALREQFDSADEDESGSIDCAELGAICSSLGEDLNRKQLKALIKEVDSNGNGTVEWDEFLMAMYSKRQDARKNGKGLLEKFSKKREAANAKKEEQIQQKSKAAELKSIEATKDREKKRIQAEKAKEKERLAIIKKNELKQAKGLEGAEQVEVQKQLAEQERKRLLREKEVKAKEVEKEIAKAKKLAVLTKKKAKEEAVKLVEVRRAEKEKYEDELMRIKEKIVDAKSKGKHNVVRLLQDKLKQMQADKNKKLRAPPKRPGAGSKKKSGGAAGAKSKGRKVFDPAKEYG